MPGGGAGILHVTGDAVLTLGATYLADLKGSVAGNSYDQLDVIGTVNLGNATLTLSLAFKPAIGDVFTIINNDADDMIDGTLMVWPKVTSSQLLAKPSQFLTMAVTGTMSP